MGAGEAAAVAWIAVLGSNLLHTRHRCLRHAPQQRSGAHPRCLALGRWHSAIPLGFRHAVLCAVALRRKWTRRSYSLVLGSAAGLRWIHIPALRSTAHRAMVSAVHRKSSRWHPWTACALGASGALVRQGKGHLVKDDDAIEVGAEPVHDLLHARLPSFAASMHVQATRTRHMQCISAPGTGPAGRF